jgi:hypothetical protein
VKQLKGKNFKGKSIEEWFQKCQPRDFWDLKTDYVARYNAFADLVIKEVHPLVAVGVAAEDGYFLNEHGAPHVTCVIKRASSLISTETCILSAYEVYILLVAIQLHDVWNILGRKCHEAQFRELTGRIDALLGDDSAEKRLIRQIAEAHGGTRNGDKDTIRYIVDEPVLNQSVRARFLAGILRFADEIADDSQRISHFSIHVDAIPEADLLFHKYSSSLQSVIVDSKGKEIKLHYDLTQTDAQQQFLKDSSKCFLIEEILRRNLKMHRNAFIACAFLYRPFKSTQLA